MDQYIIHLTNIIIIWMFTSYQLYPLPHQSYVEFRQMMLMELTSDLAKVIDPNIYMPVMHKETQPPMEIAPTVVKGPVFDAEPTMVYPPPFPSEVQKQVPPYTRHSPIIFASNRSFKGKADTSVKSKAGSKQHSERIVYKSTNPNVLDSKGNLMAILDKEEKAVYTRQAKQGSRLAEN